MKSAIPKVIHELAGEPMVWWAAEAARRATGREPVVVVGPDGEGVRQAAGEGASFVVQRERLGTGHALLQARGSLSEEAELCLVSSADMPLLRASTLGKLIAAQQEHAGPMALLTAHSDRARGFGRILRDDAGRIRGIIEQAHASPAELEIQTLNVGAYCVAADWLWERLPRLEPSPKGEYYLTDLVALAASEGREVAEVQVEDLDEVIGVNTRAHLAEAERAARRRINAGWMEAGVTLVDPESIHIGPRVRIGPDTVVQPNCYLRGETVVGARCRIGPGVQIADSTLGDDCEVTFSVVERAILEEGVDAGPFAHLREGTHLCQGVHVGNFGEVKNSTLGPGVKMGHFSYVGDATVGEGSNIGAGTITCNYDGERKHPTHIGARVFVGSDTMLIAPVRLGDGARTGAGSIVTRDIPARTLAVGMPARAIRKLEERD
jgi:bifunctional UDP-N-acetylglucosamine pyrophosphorylase/glucosamine-1-phosphate N-acetyltransferase